MKASTERKIIRWIHLIFSIPIIGLIYGPVGENPHAIDAIQWGIFPILVLSGFWLWLGHFLRKRRGKKSYKKKPAQNNLRATYS